MENERLTARTGNKLVYLINEPEEDYRGYYSENGYKTIQTVIDRLASYEDMIADGRLVEVVRCGECKHKVPNKHADGFYCDALWIDFIEGGLQDLDFCSYGERRENE